MHIRNTPHNLSDKDFRDLAGKTEGFSGSDISISVSINFTLGVRISSKWLYGWKLVVTCRLKMHYISLFVQLLMPNSSEKILQASGSFAKVLNQTLRSIPSRNLKQKSELQRYGLARKLMFNTWNHSNKWCLWLSISN